MKNLIYADNIYLIGDMGKIVQICNLLNYVKFIFGLIIWRIFAAQMFDLRITDFEIWQKRNSTYSVT